MRDLSAAQHGPIEKLRSSIDRVVRASTFEEVIFDDFAGAFEATRYLLSLGQRRIAFVGLTHLRPSLLRYLGFRAALEENGLAPSG